MALPGYDDYAKMFGGGPYAVHHAMQNIDLAKQFEQERLAGQQAANKAADLANIFNEQTLGDRVASQGFQTQTAGNTARKTQMETDEFEKLAPWRENQAVTDYVIKAKKADIDAIELEAQKMMYSPDPAMQAQGRQMMMMHKDFVKMRLQHEQNMEKEKLDQTGQQDLERIRGQNRVSASSSRNKAAGTILESVQSGKVSPANAAVAFYGAAQQAMQSGDTEGYATYLQYAQTMERLAGNLKTNPMAGKPDMGQMGVPTVPPNPPAIGAPTAQPPQHSLTDVQKMYPGVPIETLKQVYKNKYGVDLK